MDRRRLGALVCLAFTFFSSSLYASLQCPEPHEEYESIIRKLKDFEARLAPQNECSSLQAGLSDLRVFYADNMKKLKRGLRKTSNQSEVSEEEATALSDYSTAVAEKISSLIAALDQDSGKCISKEKQPSFLSSLASIARSATGLVGSFTGPYEVPIRVGGSLFAGVLLGIDKLLSGNPQYDFNDPDLHQLFVKNLCIYHDIRQEIQNTLEPFQRLRMYMEIMTLLNEKERVILEACKTASNNCDEYIKRFQSKFEIESMVADLKVKLDDACDKAESPWAQCAMLSDIIFHSQPIIVSQGPPASSSQSTSSDPLPEPKDIFESILNEVKQTENAADTLPLMEETYEKITANGFIPRRVDCWDLDATEVEAKNKRTRGIIDDMARMAKEHFEARLQALLYPSEDENVHEKRNYANWLHMTYQKRFWAFNEVVHMLNLLGPKARDIFVKHEELSWENQSLDEDKLRDLEFQMRDGSDSARQQIRLMMSQLDQRVLRDLSPQFIQWNYKQANKSLASFGKRQKQAQSDLRAKIESSLHLKLERNISIADLLKIVECPEGGKGIPNQVASNIASNVSDLINELGIVKNSLGAAAVYCDFFSRSGTMNDGILQACSSNDAQSAERAFNNLNHEKSAYEEYIDWCHLQDKVDGDNARDVIQRIKSFVEDTKKRVPSAQTSEQK